MLPLALGRAITFLASFRFGLSPRVGRGRGAARPLFVPRRRSAPAARGPGRRASIQTRPVTVPTYTPDLPIEKVEASDPLAAIRAFVPRRRVQPTEGMPRFTGGAVGALAYDAVCTFEPTVPLPERDPVGVPTAAFIETDPRPRLRPPDPHAVGDRVAPHRGGGPRGPIPDRRGGHLRSPRAHGPSERGRARRDRPGVAARAGANGSRGGAASARHGLRPSLAGPVDTSLGREEYIQAVEVAKDAIASGEAIQVVLARRQSFDLPGRSRRPARRSTGSACTGPCGGSTRAHTCSSSGPRPSRSSAPRRSCCSRPRATSSRPTRSPGPGRAAPTPARTPCSPSSSSAIRRNAPSTSCSSTSDATTSGGSRGPGP